jgi:hypothetical protein
MLNLTGSSKYVISFALCISICTSALADDIDLASLLLKDAEPNAQSAGIRVEPSRIIVRPRQKKKISNAKQITLKLKCFGREEVSHSLERKLGRTVQWWGLSPNGYLIEVYRNQKNAAWTGLLTMPDGESSCIIAGGHASIKPQGKVW